MSDSRVPGSPRARVNQLNRPRRYSRLTSRFWLLDLLDPGLFPYSQVNGAILPPVDLSLTQGAPPVGSVGYGTAILKWVEANAPDAWQGLPVGFHRSFVNTVSVKDAFPHGGANP